MAENGSSSRSSITKLRAAAPMRARVGASISARIASASAPTSRPRTRKPVTPSTISSCGPPWSETTTGRPDACASSGALPQVSVVLGKSLTSDDAYAIDSSAPSRKPVNVAGSLAFGVLAGLARSRGLLGPAQESILLVGLLGGFTTYSSFAFQTVELLSASRPIAAAAYVVATNVAALAAVWAGLRLAGA